ncbi:MAG: 30S ribosome-binding factor RbfA [Gammaproteobacteria bacterium]
MSRRELNLQIEETPRVSRPARVGAEIAHALARLIERRCADPRLALVTVTGVSMSPDLKQARVSVASADPQADSEAALAALHHAGKRLRRELAREVRLRTMPRLAFDWDHSGEEHARLDALIARGLPRAEAEAPMGADRARDPSRRENSQ